jgi:hypothetical protein
VCVGRKGGTGKFKFELVFLVISQNFGELTMRRLWGHFEGV